MPNFFSWFSHWGWWNHWAGFLGSLPTFSASVKVVFFHNRNWLQTITKLILDLILPNINAAFVGRSTAFVEGSAGVRWRSSDQSLRGNVAAKTILLNVVDEECRFFFWIKLAVPTRSFFNLIINVSGSWRDQDVQFFLVALSESLQDFRLNCFAIQKTNSKKLDI